MSDDNGMPEVVVYVDRAGRHRVALDGYNVTDSVSRVEVDFVTGEVTVVFKPKSEEVKG